MTFEEAIIISVRKYYQGRDPVELMDAQESESKYTRAYFDELEDEIINGKKEEDEDTEEDLEDELD
tara:strand:- start:307 stop:504 length:198 start_codon:yes stop_codon:yes gene_type:complete